MITRQSNTEEFIKKATAKHGPLYDYSRVDYKGSHSKVCIKCPDHGEFFQRPANHLSGSGCRRCAIKERSENKKLTQDEFIERAKNVHGIGKFDYSKVVYKGFLEKVCIICPAHGEFFQTVGNHLSGQGCIQCGFLITADKRRFTTEKFIKKAISIHGRKYDYSKIDYKLSGEKVCIICPTHGEFFQYPVSHLMGRGCIQCGFLSTANSHKHTTDIFIKKAISIHGNGSYDYSKVDYKDAKTKICIVCPIHGEFFQDPSHHLSGRKCPHCTGSNGEKVITNWFKKRGIPFLYHYFNSALRGCGKKPLHFDFCTKYIKYLIEYDGVQHFKPVRFNSSMSEEMAREAFKKLHHYDSLKNQYCIENNIPLLRISYKEFKYIPQILYGKLQSGTPCMLDKGRIKLFVNEMTPEELSEYYEGSK